MCSRRTQRLWRWRPTGSRTGPSVWHRPGPLSETAKMLREQREEETLKAFKIWPFGELGKDKSTKP